MRTCIGNVDELVKKKCQKFYFKEDNEQKEGILFCKEISKETHKEIGKETRKEIGKENNFFAYRNRCAHIPLPLDFGDDEFLTEDETMFLCRNHGALYEPSSGECVSGPSCGRFLEKIKLEIKDGKLYLNL